jgi:hypothetical protein
VQRLRVHRHAALSLAVQLLPPIMRWDKRATG